jgi:hypothetical protein
LRPGDPFGIWNISTFGPSWACKTSAFILSVTARDHPLLRPLLTSPLRQLVAVEISPGKGHILQSMPAASTALGLLSTGFAELCLLTHPKWPRYAVPVRRYGPLQSRFLQCRGHPLPPCALLTGFDNSPVRDLHPLDTQRTLLPCGRLPNPCRAHTAPKRQQALRSPIEREVVNLKDRSFEAGPGKPAGV